MPEPPLCKSNSEGIFLCSVAFSIQIQLGEQLSKDIAAGVYAACICRVQIEFSSGPISHLKTVGPDNDVKQHIYDRNASCLFHYFKEACGEGNWIEEAAQEKGLLFTPSTLISSLLFPK